ncbi:CIC11C00000004952 [Sungouiella intermedia]|uniref:CIC11C00000004952 n=1 Tax=Sungouiella intermedia TaxID=45354 RepID=A0A1L0FVW3_9ASCO|nr:CIC11C00000004952 [[Candida] intermedia]
MHFSLWHIVAFCSLWSQALSIHIHKRVDSVYEACATLHMRKANPHSYDVDYSTYCDTSNAPYFGSIALCINDYGDRYIHSFLQKCAMVGSDISTFEFEKSYTNATNFAVSSLLLNAGVLSLTLPLLFPSAEISAVAEGIYKDGLSANYLVYFATALTLYWFVVCIIAGICNWSRFIFPKTATMLFFSKPVSFIRRYLVVPPLLRSHHFDTMKCGSFEWLVPLRFEAILLFGYFVLAAVFCGANITHGLVFVSQNIGDRSGVLVTYTLPVLILFGGRNNFLQFITGWQFSRFLIFHRWVARVSFLLLMVHVGAKTVTIKKYGEFPLYLYSGYMVAGIIAVVASGFLMLFSLIWFRRNRYELFLLIHYIFAILFIGGGWKHVEHHELQGFFIAAVGVWGYNALVRIIRVALFGIRDATIELKAEETIRVTIHRPSWWVPHAGSHGFVHFFTPTAFWQSHPFCMVDSPIEENTVCLYAKIKGGMTHGLYKKLLDQPNRQMTIKVSLEGPYFERMPLHTMDRLTFLSSGNGITGMYAGAREMSKSSKHVKLIWTIRDYCSISWFFNELKALEALNVEVNIYVTRGASTNLSCVVEKEINLLDSSFRTTPSIISLVSSLKELLCFIQFFEGRPDMYELIEQEMEIAGTQSLGVATCGPPGMVDSARVGVQQYLISHPNARIELFEQYQLW